MSKMKTQAGEEVICIKDKLKVFRDSPPPPPSLYASEPVDQSRDQEYLEGAGVAHLEEDDKMEEEVTRVEIEQEIYEFTNGKSQGIDGYRAEFYKRFKEQIS